MPQGEYQVYQIDTHVWQVGWRPLSFRPAHPQAVAFMGCAGLKVRFSAVGAGVLVRPAGIAFDAPGLEAHHRRCQADEILWHSMQNRNFDGKDQIEGSEKSRMRIERPSFITS